MENPQARREVLAQTLEYASLMQRLSYSDLTAKLKSIFYLEDTILFRKHLNGLEYKSTKVC